MENWHHSRIYDTTRRILQKFDSFHELKDTKANQYRCLPRLVENMLNSKLDPCFTKLVVKQQSYALWGYCSKINNLCSIGVPVSKESTIDLEV